MALYNIDSLDKRAHFFRKHLDDPSGLAPELAVQHLDRIVFT
jgi:hypothetical protein